MTLLAQFAALGGGSDNYIENVFSSWLYTGNGSTQTITNGINLSTYGGMVWTKNRTSTTNPVYNNRLYDSVRGINTSLISNSTAANDTLGVFTSWNTDGFSLGGGNPSASNNNGDPYVSWTFRKQPKFFDIVTWTGNGANRTIAHNLDSVPGCIIVKRTDTSGAWAVYHRSLANTDYLVLNTTAASATGATYWNSTTATSSVFSLGTATDVNANGATYVAYLFAHNAGGFGLTGNDNVISCGSYTGTGAVGNTVTLGYEPQWLLVKKTNNVSDWVLVDNMRGFSLTNNRQLFPNSNAAEDTAFFFNPTATGFTLETTSTYANGSGSTYIYIAIRRGPMKVPTSGTSVFVTRVRTGDNDSTPAITPSVAMTTDITLTMNRSGGAGGSAGSGAVGGFVAFDRLRGNYRALYTISANSEPSPGAVGFAFDRMDGVIGQGLDAGQFFNYDTNNSSYSYINYFFRRAPSVFDEVCYTGTGSARTVTHNLGVVPELMIVKRRDTTGDWWVYDAATGNTKYQVLNSTATPVTSATAWNNTTPTSSVFTVGTGATVNASGGTYVAYLFATCPGVSKVGSYTGTATAQIINCNFTGGARFVMIKRTDSNGDWYVWDSARGMVAGNDPYLLINSNAAEVTSTDYIDTAAAGFEITNTAPAAINANGGNYIFLAIA